MTSVLIMNGTGGSGKGTAVEYLRELFELKIHEYSSIDFVKAVATCTFGWDGKKDVEGRNLLAAIKQAMIAYNDLPTKKVIKEIEWATNFGVDILAVDIREPDEIEKLVNHCIAHGMQCVTCRVINNILELEAEKNGLSLTGDRLYGKYDYDVEIYNNGTLPELKATVLEIFEDVYNYPRPKGKLGRKCGMCRGKGMLKSPDNLDAECVKCEGTGWLKPMKDSSPTAMDSIKYGLKVMAGTIDPVKGSNKNEKRLPFSSLLHGKTCCQCDSENVFYSPHYNALICDYCNQIYNRK